VPDPDATGLLPAVAELRLADHHCHGVIRRDVDRPEFEAMLTEADYADEPGVTMFGSQLGLALRRWCPPVLGLDPHAGPDEYLAARAGLGHEEVSRRFLRAAGLDVLYVDTGFEPEPLTSPAELAALAGAQAREVVRLEQVAEAVGARLAGDPSRQLVGDSMDGPSPVSSESTPWAPTGHRVASM